MIPGEALTGPYEPRYVLPGMRHSPNVGDTAALLVIWLCSVIATIFLGVWIVEWVRYAPDNNTCVTVPADQFGLTLDYRGYDGAWLFNNNVIGYSLTEDTNSCLSQLPLRGN